MRRAWLWKTDDRSGTGRRHAISQDPQLADEPKQCFINEKDATKKDFIDQINS